MEIINILLIEDNPADARLIDIYLRESFGTTHKLFTVDYLAKGVELAEKNKFAAIILDLTLPDSSGLNSFTQIHEKTPETPVIVLTGLEDESLGFNAVKLGAQDFLVKGDIKSKDLKRSINYSIERSKMLKELSENTTKLEEKTNALLKEKFKLSEAQKLAHIGNWEWDIKADTIEWSDELFRIHGLVPNELKMSFKEFLKRVHPEDEALVEKTFLESRNTREPFNLYYRIVRSDSAVRTLHVRGEVVQDEAGNAITLLGTGQDITDRLHEEEMEKLAVAATKSFNSVVIANRTGEIEWVNEGFLKLTGYTLSDMKKTHGELLRLGNATGLSVNTEQYETVVEKKKPVTYESRNFTKDGAEYWVITTLTPVLGKTGEVERIIAIDTDITQRKKIEVDLVRANHIAEHSLMKGSRALDELTKAKKQLEQSMRIKEQFMANMSHEIRTPMNAIVVMTEILTESDLAKEQRECVNAIKVSADNLLSIINDILDFSKIESGKITFEKIPFVLKAVLEESIKTLHFSSSKKGLKLTYTISENIPSVIIGDGVRLRQILLNLVSNSVKFTVAGSVSVDVQIKEQNNDSYILLFTVSDTGIGIPEDKLSVIFESFTQASNETTRKYGGTGLGLAIVKQLVELQKGTIWVESQVNVGTKFFVTLPFKKGDLKQIEENDTEAQFSYNELENLKVLLVEDNLMNQMVANKVLKKWNMQTDVAENGKVAIEKLKQTDYDIILMDIQMPEMDGIDATKYIREEMKGAKSKIPIIAMTAHAMVGEDDKCRAAGMNDYISKPFNQKALYEKIINLTNKDMDTTTSAVRLNRPETPAKKESLIDLTYLYEIADGSNQFLKEMIETFIEQTPPMLDKMQTLLKEEKWDELSRLAHKMKPTIDFMGLHSIRDTVKNIEKYSRELINLNQLPDMLTKVKDGCLMAIEELKIEAEKIPQS